MRRVSVKLALFATTTLAGAVPAMAQDAGGDIVVTARRTEERLQDVPISMAVFSQQQLTNKNIVSGADLATYTPSLSANSRYGSETATFAIRGFTQESFTSPSVAIYFADVVGPRAQGGTPGGNGAGVGQYFDLQNVQVLKGPQGTLFGRNTTGGAVLLVPERPTDVLEGYLEGSYGNYDMYRMQGVVNVPLSDTFKVRLGFDRQKRDGYLKNQSTRGPDAFGDVNYWAARLGILAELTPDLESYTLARFSHSDTNGVAGKMVTAAGCLGNTTTPTPGSTAQFLAPLGCKMITDAAARGDGYWDVAMSAANPFLKIDQWAVSNTTTWVVNDTLTVKNIASYQEFRQKQSFNIGSDDYAFPATTQFGAPSPYAGLPFTWVGLNPDSNFPNVSQWTATEELQIQGRTSDGKLNYVLGGYYEKSGPLNPFQGSLSPISYTTQIPIAPGISVPVLSSLSCTDIAAYQCTPINSLGVAGIPGLIQNSLTRYRYRNAGFFGQGTYKITDQLSVTAGLRYTMDKVAGQGGTRQAFFFAPNTPTFVCAAYPGRPAPSGENCLTNIAQKSNKPTWLIDLDYKPTPDMLVYAKYARGYRQGNVNASNTIPISWGPEKVEAYEIGVKTSFRGAVSGYLNLAAFYNDFSNQQLTANLIPDASIPNNTSSPAQAIVNAGKSRIQGIEVDGSINFSGLSIALGYAYLDTKLKSYSPPNFPGYLPPSTGANVGGPLPQSPKHKLTVTPTYTLPLDDSLGRISISGTYIYTAKQIALADSPVGVLPSSQLVNFNLNWNDVLGGPIDASAFVTNAFNEKYPVFVSGSFASIGSESIILGMPRMYGIRLRYRFGD
ncbi:TonB-dependent receptor [Novosphingobium resinovorum]|uniref:TonB-dependent receptor n=1 Tax=Sphingomonadaceae TaxID=41297 RepID=UPI0002D5C26B|nr:MULTISPECIES: TonB-dependent receptor [Sphingomonadaceae]MBF7014019.1 TonB-dependent receptor [Novosphingobium sp. HR1a]WJM26162.1 TonB-dependent receptor [Novosphingobium resinovorum]